MENTQNPQEPQDPREPQNAPQAVPAAASPAAAPASTPPRRSHTVLTVLASAVAAVVLFAGGVLVGHAADLGDGPRDPAGMSGDRVPGGEQRQHGRDGAPGADERGTAPAPEGDATPDEQATPDDQAAPDDQATQGDRSSPDDGSTRERRSAPDSTDRADSPEGTSTSGASA
ncbi:hypothetical protein ACGIF2_13680 [Cellulomonas sp. P22]|uniref:hypothetical protein n=1 Tax=Cellulomonas sp. P22 TaxID=3373189 RepID=UPI003792031D